MSVLLVAQPPAAHRERRVSRSLVESLTKLKVRTSKPSLFKLLNRQYKNHPHFINAEVRPM